MHNPASLDNLNVTLFNTALYLASAGIPAFAEWASSGAYEMS